MDTDTFAAAIRAAHETCRRAPCPVAPTTAQDAYRIQAAVARGPVAGFKTARKPGQPQIMAPLMARDVVESGARVASRFGGPLGVELEVGLRLRAPLPAPDDPCFLTALADCVEPLAVIELVDTRLEGPAASDPLAKLADAQINAGLVVGPPLRGWTGDAISEVAARMVAGETALLDGATAVPGGDVRVTLQALAIMLGDHCGGLQPGQIVITGSLHPLTYVDPGARVTGQIQGFGEVHVDIG